MKKDTQKAQEGEENIQGPWRNAKKRRQVSAIVPGAMEVESCTSWILGHCKKSWAWCHLVGLGANVVQNLFS